MKTEKYEGKNAGFSLVEVLFAMIFMTIIVFGVITLQTSNIRLSNTQNNENKAYFLASQGAEIAEALGSAAVAGCSSGCFIQLASDYSIVAGGGPAIDDIFYRQLQVATEPLTLPGAFLVNSKVTWTDSSGAHEVTAKRIVY